MRHLLTILFIVWLIPTGLQSQMALNEFSTNPVEYLSQLETMMTASKREVLVNTFTAFEKVFKSGYFSAPEVDTIIVTSNRMLTNRMMASPFFEYYLQGLLVAKSHPVDGAKQFLDWHNVLFKILTSSSTKTARPFSDFLDFSRYFLKDNTLRYSELGSNWIARNADYKLMFDNQNKLPYLEFVKTDLMAIRQDDSIRIQQTSGYYFPTLELWKGKGGKVAWNDRFDLKEQVYVEFTDTFSIRMNTSLYGVKKVNLTYPSYFGDKKIEGKFEDKLIGKIANGDVNFPIFESKDEVLNIDNIGKGIYFTGGFRLNGLTVYGYGSKNSRAKLEIFDEGSKELKFRGRSELVIIKKEENLVGDQVEAVIYNGKDSIYHPSVSIRFNILTKELQLKRGKRGSDRNPFFSSIHQMNIETENMLAYFEQDSMVIGKQGAYSSARPEASFESLLHYSETDYIKAQGISTINPIAIVAATAEKEGRIIDANLIARRMNSKFTEESIQTLLYEMVADGFIDYDTDAHSILVKDKLIHYARASQKKVDFDGLSILSVSKEGGANASLDMKTNEIRATGIKNIEFSPKQRVAIIPDDSTIIIQQNRDMKFDGKLFAGYSVLNGKGFKFNYNRYHIELDSVEYFQLYPQETDGSNPKNVNAYTIDSKIEGLNGVLLIDAPSNKSSKEDIKIFPSFQSRQKSYVYYQKPEIQSGVYLRDSFHFELDKFSFNHLDSFSARDVHFLGRLVSFDIFPIFEEELVVREADQSLGFLHNTPKEGYLLYKEKGNYLGEIDLSNKGLLGKGDLTYLGAKFHSEDVIFKPHQLTASANTFEHTENKATDLPQVNGLDVKIDWRPYKDSMYVKTEKEPFSVYKANLHTLDGTIIVTPEGVRGRGKLDWNEAFMQSNMFQFGTFALNADTTSISIKAAEDKPALRTKNVNGKVDFDQKNAYFKANDQFLVTELPYVDYQTSMNEFEWNMDNKKVSFKSDPKQLGMFLSVHRDQDSLKFNGANALYDLVINELQIDGVPFLEASDALIYPDSGHVVIKPNAVMDTLENAKIIANTVNQNHVINRATVAIQGRRAYTAKGYYEYNIGDRKQEIEFSDIKGTPVGKGSYKEKESVTRANGSVEVEDSFYIDIKTEFQGKISLSAEKKELAFDGFARLNAEKLPQRPWFRVKFDGDKKDLSIKFDSPKDPEGIPLETGFYVSKEMINVYPSMIAPLAMRKDRCLLSVAGLLNYDEKTDAFIFADSLKALDEKAWKGNRLIFNNKTGKITGEGKLNIGTDLKYIKLATAGTIETQVVAGTDSTSALELYQTKVEAMAAVDLILPEKLIEIIIKDLRSAGAANLINYARDPMFYRKAGAELFPLEKEVVEALEQVNLGALNMPAKFNKHTFLFSNLPMKWNKDYQSFVSTGDKLGLVSIKGELFNYVYKGYVEVRMPNVEGDDRLYIYIESPSGFNYYFGFKGGILSVTSTNPAFEEAAAALKAKDMILKMPDGLTYEIQLSNSTISSQFVNRMKAVAN